MKTRTSVVAIGALVAALACGGEDPAAAGSGADAFRPQGGAGPRAGGFDAMWMLQMIPHHETAVEMGEACLGAAGVRGALVELCDGVVRSQSAEIALMTGWLGEWYGVTAPAGATMGGGGTGGGMMGGGRGGMPGGGMGDGAELEGLEGAAFERAFLDDMIPHHELAVHMSTACLARASHEELRSLCGDIIRVQTAEITQMEAWRCEWFGACDAPGATPGGGWMPGGRPMRPRR